MGGRGNKVVTEPPDPDVQHCGACKTTARFEFYGDTKNCGNCGQDYPYEEHERGQREAAA